MRSKRYQVCVTLHTGADFLEGSYKNRDKAIERACVFADFPVVNYVEVRDAKHSGEDNAREVVFYAKGV